VTEEQQPGSLRDVVLIGLAEPMTPRDGADDRAVAPNQSGPGLLVAAGCGVHGPYRILAWMASPGAVAVVMPLAAEPERAPAGPSLLG
jgi:hypothetical protein